MNQYIITREKLFGQTYLIPALFDENRKLLELHPVPESKPSLLGNIYIGRVEKIVKNLNAAFVRIGKEQICYLSCRNMATPVFTKKISTKHLLSEGDELLVQVVVEAIKTKEPAITTELKLPGTYIILTAGKRTAGVSAKIPEPERSLFRERMDVILNEFPDSPAFGVIVRTNARYLPDEVLKDELDELHQTYQKLMAEAPSRTAYSLLYQEPKPYLKRLRDVRLKELSEIVTDDRTIFEEICVHYGVLREDLMTKGSVPVPVDELTLTNGIQVKYHHDDAISLGTLFGLKAKISGALKERVWLKSGAYLVIQPTEALTVIDVNTGKNIAKKDPQENFLKVNLEAAIEIAYQLRLRNISGIILVDFINSTSKEATDELLSLFRDVLKGDPVPTTLVDITKLGLVEITRKKIQKSLAESLEKTSG